MGGRISWSSEKESETVRKKRNGTLFCGLTNFGNTCYFNAVIASLFSSQKVRYILNSTPSRNDPVLTQLCALFRDLAATRSGTLAPKAFFKTVTQYLRPDWTTAEQQDAHELLNMLLNHIECPENSTIPKDPDQNVLLLPNEQFVLADKVLLRRASTHFFLPSVSSLFEGFVAHVTRCLRCDWSSSRLERFYDLCLDMEPTLGAGLQRLEVLEYMAENIECEECACKQPGVRSSFLKRIPNILVLQFKRFAYDSRYSF